MRDGRLTLSAQNAGDVALKIASPELSVGGTRFSLSEGLLGYVLGRSSMSWTLSLPSGRRPRPGAAILNYRTETGEVSVPVTISADG
jgi:fimbrial chaperone protein